MSLQNRILITSALPYINGVKHLGNLAGSMLPADVYARFERLNRGVKNVLFLCATDEHGTPAELAAAKEGLDTKVYCDLWYDKQRTLFASFDLSFDYFGRSSSVENHELTQAFARILWETGYLEERSTRQIYSLRDHRYLPDRYVIGTCPHCGYFQARGDQCENCTRVLDPTELISPHSAISGSSDLQIRETKHLFLKQSDFVAELRGWISMKAKEWSPLVKSIALKWLDEGLNDRGITRDLEWGIPVNAAEWGRNPEGNYPDTDGLKNKVFYVWFDAPIEYIAATQEWAASALHDDGTHAKDDEVWKRWWKLPTAADVRYVQFMGKDNVPFHTIGFPCTVMGVNKSLPEPESWKLVDEIKGFNWLNYYGKKFSTSQKVGIFMDQALELLPSDYWRWYLIANTPENSDSSFVWEHFAAVINKDLADVLGNFVNRTLKFTATKFAGVVPESTNWTNAEFELAAALSTRISAFKACMEALQFRKAATELRSIWVLGNEYITASAPWTWIDKDRERAARSIAIGVNLIGLVGYLSSPIIPRTADLIMTAVAFPTQDSSCFTDIEHALKVIKPNTLVQVPPLLFTKIEKEMISKCINAFGGP